MRLEPRSQFWICWKVSPTQEVGPLDHHGDKAKDNHIPKTTHWQFGVLCDPRHCHED